MCNLKRQRHFTRYVSYTERLALIKVMKRVIVLISALLVITLSAPAQEVSNHYNKVDQLIWVVHDLKNTIDGWEKLGFTEVIELDTLSGFSKKKNVTFNVLCAKANLGGAQITWLQPLDQNSVFSEFHKIYGDGVMSVIHRMENEELIDQEITKLSKVHVLDEIIFSTPKGDINYIMLDTYQNGKYLLGFTSSAADQSIFQELSSDNRNDLIFSQYAFTINDVSKTSKYWHSLGLPEIRMFTPVLSEKAYYNNKSSFEVALGWQSHGTIPYEWVISTVLPTIHNDHIKSHGEGFHHLGFDVHNMEKVLEYYNSENIEVISAGAWGDKGKPSSGVFKYLNTDNYGGVILELIWRYEKS